MALTPQWFMTGRYGFDIEDNEMEIGVGIHGEKGLHRESIQPINQIISTLKN